MRHQGQIRRFGVENRRTEVQNWAELTDYVLELNLEEVTVILTLTIRPHGYREEGYSLQEVGET